MNTTTVSTTIRAPREHVFAAMTNIDGFAELVPAIIRCENLTGAPMQLGTRWRETRRMFGKDASEEMTVAAFDPPNSYTATAESHGSQYLSRWEFVALSADQTRVKLHFSAIPQSLFAKVMTKLVRNAMTRSVAKMLEADLAAIKASLELREYPARPESQGSTETRTS